MGHVIAERYRLDSTLGQGGMGRVWRGYDLRLGREVAVKTVDLTALPDPSMAARFQQEIVATAQLSHPNIVTVFDGGVDGATAYLVMELLPGRTLAQEVAARGPLPVGEVIRIARQVVQGLAAAHAVGLIHRDVKPANVMLFGGRAKVLDFGIAHLANGAGAGLTATATTIGTAAYMAPEQAGGRPVSPATDLYAVGCLLMMMLTGRPPFEGEAIAVATQQLSATPPRLSARLADAPVALDELVARLLAKQPELRPGTTETLGILARIAVDPGPTVPMAVVTRPATPPPPVAPVPVRTTPLTTVPTAVARPAAPAAPPPATRSGMGWAVGVIVTLIAALVVAGVSYAFARQLGATVTRMMPSASAKATPSKATSRPPTSARPSTTPPTTPAASNGALDAALAAVRTALNALPDGKEKDQLLRSWDRVTQVASSGGDPTKRLDDFEAAVEVARDLGVVGRLQYEAIKGGLMLVRTLT